MFMGKANGVYLYKHGITRSYLYLDDDGNCYVKGERGCYFPADFNQELAKLEDCLKSLGATLETPYDDRFIAQKREVLRREGISLVTVHIEPGEVTIH
jgi:hypothetical protein